MSAMMIDDREGIAASGAIFQRHASPIAGFSPIASSLILPSSRLMFRRDFVPALALPERGAKPQRLTFPRQVRG